MGYSNMSIEGEVDRLTAVHEPQFFLSCKNPLGLVPTSVITIIVIITSENITLLCRLCLSGDVQKHNHRRPYDKHNHNHKKMIDYFLMIMIMSLTMTMSLSFVVGKRKS